MKKSYADVVVELPGNLNCNCGTRRNDHYYPNLQRQVARSTKIRINIWTCSM